jgi:hypothetical protein
MTYLSNLSILILIHVKQLQNFLILKTFHQMETMLIDNDLLPVLVQPKQSITVEQDIPTHKALIKGNTVSATYSEIKQHHTIPVFVKDNEPAISHIDFIDAVYDVASYIYGYGNVSELEIPIKGVLLQFWWKLRRNPVEVFT